MKYCQNCGNAIEEDGAKFCTHCGASIAVIASAENTASGGDVKNNAAAQQPSEQPKAPKEKPPKKPIDLTKIDDKFWLFFIILGVCAFVLIQLSGTYVLVSFGMAVIFGILAIFAAGGFCALGVVRYLSFKKANDGKEDKDKAGEIRYTVCFALGIIVMIYALLQCIMIFAAVGQLGELYSQFAA